jgi:hypothetical protein
VGEKECGRAVQPVKRSKLKDDDGKFPTIASSDFWGTWSGSGGKSRERNKAIVVIELVKGADDGRSVEDELGDMPVGMKLCPTLKVCNFENRMPSGIRGGGDGTPASMKIPNSSS